MGREIKRQGYFLNGHLETKNGLHNGRPRVACDGRMGVGFTLIKMEKAGPLPWGQ